MTAGIVHVVGAGLAGLAAAVQLARSGHTVRLSEAAPQAGGRCRSYFDTTLGLSIDNGNHLLLSANHAALAYLDLIGAGDALTGPATARFPFIDRATGQRWTLRPNDGPLPWWIFSPDRRVPGTRAHHYLAASGILLARSDRKIGEVMTCNGPLYDRLWGPVLLAGLNTPPEEGSTRLASALMRETLLAGGQACRPLVAARGLSTAFVDPALAFLAAHGASLRFGRRLRGLTRAENRVTGLHFSDGDEVIGMDDSVILAVPAGVAGELMPELSRPTRFQAIVNVHFKVAPPQATPLFTGVVNGMTEWIFAFDDRVSVTISAADRLLEVGREQIASTVWGEVAPILGLDMPMPVWQVVKERRATFAATPDENRKRPGVDTDCRNLALAGDWTATGLPATIEGAIRSGNTAASRIAGAGRTA